MTGVQTCALPIFQLTQRADFFEEEVGLETTLKRPIINTRDEPHADPLRYRRLHVIVGDANLCEVATFLKVGTTAIVLAMVDDDFLHREARFADPVRALQEVSLDQSLGRALELADGTTATAIELQWDLLEQGRKYVEERGDEGVGGPVAHDVLDRWGEVLATLEEDPEPLVGVVDWVTKRHIINGYRDRHGLQPDDLRLMALDLQYHDLRPERSLFARMGAETLVDPADVERGMTTPPEGTRAYFRGRCLDRWPDSVVAANWDSMVFDAGEESLRRVPMMEPTRGSRAHVATLIDDCDDITELLDRLSGRPG